MLLGSTLLPSVPSPAAAGDAIVELGAVQAVAAMRRGDLTAEACAGALLARAERLVSLNAFRTLDAAAVLEAARAADRARARGATLGRLHGLPIPIKDSVNTRGLPTSNGTRALKAFRPAEDAGLVARLLAEGAIVMGKTNLHEISFGWSSDNAGFGPVRNPYDPSRSPGGSSGGSAAAVAARMAPLAVAEDTWGSIRLPAAFCGLAGLRPSRGRYPDDGIMPLTRAFDRAGPLARSVEDLVLFDAVAADDAAPVTAPAASGLRIALPSPLWAGLDPEVERVARDAVTRLRAAGVTLVEAPPPADAERAGEIVGTVVAHELRDSLADFLHDQGTGLSFEALHAQLGTNVRSLMEALALPPHRPSRAAYEAAQARRERLTADLTAYIHAHRAHALAFPAAMVRPPRIGEETEVSFAGRTMPAFEALGRNAALGSAAGLASLVLPAGLDGGGLPVGLEFAAPLGGDRSLLALGLTLERVLGAPPAPRGA
ncbi:MAG: amidase family protein [Methylobacterium frigidaeris]